MADFSAAVPYTRTSETTAVKMPSGATPRIILSRKPVGSLKNLLCDLLDNRSNAILELDEVERVSLEAIDAIPTLRVQSTTLNYVSE
jgi:hypothetical protein